ncbi:DMT family transporter [Streptomyces sp. WMMB 322]|uniref:DMT family transporter n=1 Tax=Streptomyces sp. WMMB 322 TaxID=1286821 RepID=UPI0006E19F08|nr:DMT family transporter [Streptomyces sp. WMMB 322]SCK09759.1 Threonine/homoserine efflux transporter RhtA [Streptomyces sp. WMMB 322]
MAVICIVGSVLLQAGMFGYISGRLDPTDSLYLSCAGFGSAAVLFNALLLFRRGNRPRRADPEPKATGLLVLMNIVTAITFLGFYTSLAWIPAALASGTEAAVGPIAIALLALVGYGQRATRRGWFAAGLLVLLGAGVAYSLTDLDGSEPAATAFGLALVVIAGVGAAGLALISAELGRREIDPVRVTAHRFHLTYLAGGALLVSQGGPGDDWTARLPEMLATGAAAVAVPLFLLQAGIQHVDSMVAMALLTTLPGATYLAETAFHGEFSGTSFGLILCLTAVAAWYAKTATKETDSAPAGGDGVESPQGPRTSAADPQPDAVRRSRITEMP